ncbi:MAG TPA: hypothetical protein VE954_22045 [Oligoflexus sp.]|uniref:hypothetical protein n=1 Tax=Oligoflexus sp. TaxID=1971216 RepID=UPI002D6888E2|nr:hypothetical protein [Oligoflexus sp.]HYX35789.1 hypothetical protein [Oligoflexus sp.]
MGLEAINFAYLPPESKSDVVLNDFSKLPGIIPKIGGGQGRYVIKNDDYLIDFLVQGKNLSVRIALCCSSKSIEKVFDIFKTFSEKYGGQLKVIQSKKVIVHFTNDDLKSMVSAFEERRKVFVEQIADISNMPLSSDDVFNYIRQENIKPKGYQIL